MSPLSNLEQSIDEICDLTWKPLYHYIYYKVQNREEAEDIVQEAYMRAIPYLKKGKVHPDKYIQFMKTVALNVLRDSWRKMKREGVTVSIDAVAPIQEESGNPEEINTSRMFVEYALRKLSEDDRRIIELRILQGYSVADTAKVLQKTEGAVRVAQHRALKRLAEKLNSMNKGMEESIHE